MNVKGRAVPWTLATALLLGLALLAPRGPSTPQPQAAPAIVALASPTPIDLTESQPQVALRAARPSQVQRPPTVLARPKARPLVMPPPPRRDDTRQPEAEAQTQNYPRAQRQTAKPVAAVAPANSPAALPSPSPSSSEHLAVESSYTWRSLPADGSPMNGHVVIEIGAGDLKPVGDAARDIMVLVDVSPSMKSPLEICRNVTEALGELPSTDRKALVLFANAAKMFEGDISMARISQEVKLEEYPLGAGTDMLEGIFCALAREHEGGNRATRFVIISDGLTNNEAKCLSACKEADVPVTVLGMGGRCNKPLLQKMAKTTEGRFREVKQASGVRRALTEEFNSIPPAVARDSRLIVTFAEGVQVSRAYRLAPAARNLGKPKMKGQTVEIPLGDIRQGETVRIAFDVLAPSRPQGDIMLALGRVESADGASTDLPPIQLTFSGGVTRPERNPTMRVSAAEIQWAGSRKR